MWRYVVWTFRGGSHVMYKFHHLNWVIFLDTSIYLLTCFLAYLFTHWLTPNNLMQHMLSTIILLHTLSWVFFSTSMQLLFILLVSVFITWRYVFFRLPLLHWPSRFHVTAWLVMQLSAFLSVYPIHLQRFFLISFTHEYLDLNKSSI